MSSNHEEHRPPRPVTTTAADGLGNHTGTPQWVIRARAKLRELTALGPNWDSHAGLPLQPAIADSAARLLGWLETEDLPVPAVVLGSGGTVQFEWRAHGRELEVEVLPGGKLGYLQVFPDSHLEEGEITHQLPEQLRRLAHWLTHG